MSNGRNDLKYEVLGKTNQIYFIYFIPMETIIISIEWDYWVLSNIYAEEVFNELNNFWVSQINDVVFLGLDYLTEIRDSKTVFKKIDKKWKKFLIS